MKRLFLFFVILFSTVFGSYAQKYTPESLPDSFYSGEQGDFHVQGMAVDQKNGYIYFSFTDELLKMDIGTGKVVGSVTGLIGHLGDLTFDPETNKIYGSLEYKDDAIGQGISNKLGVKNSGNINFYIAIFDGSKITNRHMDAAKGDVLKTVYLKEVVDDYKAKVKLGNRVVQHRFGCSGIDGTTIAPAFGKKNKKKEYFYVAYGIYGDTTRNDNNYQVILKYDMKNWDKLGQRLTQDNLHHSGPKKPMAKYFVKTGNTNWGIQNLEYDPSTGNFFAAVYKGSKPEYPNYNLFVIDGHKKPKRTTIISDNKGIKVETLSLLQAGLKDENTGIRGWYFKWGSTGLFPLGNGSFYISHNKKTQNGQQETTVYKYKWVGSDKEAFRLVR